jgi:predicted transcriptional regulator of viral defense system
MKAEEPSHRGSGAVEQRVRALELLGANGMLRLKDLIAQGVWPETLARLVRGQAVIRRSRGLYQLADASVEPGHVFAEAATLVPKGVICLISALQFHELTLQTPSAVWMSIDRKAWRPKINYPPIRFVRWNATSWGVSQHRIEGAHISITNVPRTIVDCFRYRNKVGLDVAMEGLREGLRNRRCTPDELWRYAQKGRIWSVMRPYVEAMVANE